MSILAHVRFTPFVGLPVIIDGNMEIARDGIGNLTISWRDPIATGAVPQRLTLAALAHILCEGVAQLKNRAGAYLVVTDPGGSLCRVAWREIDPWRGELLAEQQLVGVAALGNARASPADDSLSLIIYRATHRFQRGTNLIETVPL